MAYNFEEDKLCTSLLNDAVTNCTTVYNDTSMGSPVLNKKPEAVAVPLAFAVIFLVGVTGNLLLILNFARHKNLSTPHNALVVNLAAGDLLMLVAGLPVNSVWYTIPYWPFGDLLCRLSRFAETFATAVTVATLTILSVERYLIVTGRRRREPLSSVLIVTVVTVWAVGFVLSLPDLVSARLVHLPEQVTNGSGVGANNGDDNGIIIDGSGGGGGGSGGSSSSSGRSNVTWEICVNHDPDWGEAYARVNVMSKFLVLFVLPLLIIAPCHLGLAFHLFFKMFGTRKGAAPTSKTPLRPNALPAAPVCVRPGAGDDDVGDDHDDDDTKPLNDVTKDGNHVRRSSASITSSRNDVSVSSIPAAAAAAAAAAANLHHHQHHHQQQQEQQKHTQKSSSSSHKRGGGKKAMKPATRKRRRLAWTVLGLVVSFVLCWMPRHIFLLWYHFDPSLFNHFWHVFKILGFCLMFSNSAVNPFVFYVLDVGFRAFVNSALLCRNGKSKKSSAAKKKKGRGGGDGGGGGGGVEEGRETEGASGVDGTMVGEMSPTEDRRSCFVMSEMPSGGTPVAV